MKIHVRDCESKREWKRRDCESKRVERHEKEGGTGHDFKRKKAQICDCERKRAERSYCERKTVERRVFERKRVKT